MPQPKPTPEKPNLFTVQIRVSGEIPDCKAFVHFLGKLEETDFIYLKNTPTLYKRGASDRRRGKPLTSQPGKEYGQVYTDITFTYPDYPELQ